MLVVAQGSVLGDTKVLRMGGVLQLCIVTFDFLTSSLPLGSSGETT